MIILLSPAKKQVRQEAKKGEPLLFENEKNELLKVLTHLSVDQIKKDFKVSDAIAQNTFESFQNIDETSLAIDTYTGEAYKTLSAKSLTPTQREVLNEHVLIFSALYGLLKPFNAITLYRLDLLNKFEINLKDYWKKRITNHLNKLNRPLLNLASGEFMSLVDLDKLNVDIIHVHFLTQKGKETKVVSAHAKKARGAFARACLLQGFDHIEAIEVEGFKFSHKDANHYTYLKQI